MVENILTTSNQVVEVRTKPDSVKMPSNYTTTVTNESLPTLNDDDDGLFGRSFSHRVLLTGSRRS